MAAFVLMRKDFKYRNQIAMFFYFPSIFSGGLLPGYLLIVNGLQLKDTLWALILPGLLGAWNIFMMRNFMTDIPDSIMESAKLDGANDFVIFTRLYLPLSKAGLATIGLFIALGYWNNWANAKLYINSSKLYPLQYLLYRCFPISGAQGCGDAERRSHGGPAGGNLPYGNGSGDHRSDSSFISLCTEVLCVRNYIRERSATDTIKPEECRDVS